jgi:DNA-binding LytR/AlgR family response regulator
MSDELRGRRFLVVEDEYVIATDIAVSLNALGVEVAGPVASVAEALALLESNGDRLDGAVLDINLGNERVFPVADVLRGRGIPFVFTTGYDAAVVPNSYSDVPRCEKPVDERRLVHVLSGVTQRDKAGET